MITVFRYRLQPLLDQKVEQKNQAAAALGEATRELECRRQRLEHLQGRKRELEETRRRSRMSLLPGEGAYGRDLSQRSDFLRGLEIDADEARQAVFSQRISVEEAEELAAQARQRLAERSREVEVLSKHRERSERRWRQEMERRVAEQQEEIGALMHQLRRRRG